MLRKKEKWHKQEKGDSFKKPLLFVFLFCFLFNFHLTGLAQQLFSSSSGTQNQNTNKEAITNKQVQPNKLNELDTLEEKIFHQTYSKDAVEERTSRLEEFLFGEKQSKGTLEERIQKINNAINPKKEQSAINNRIEQLGLGNEQNSPNSQSPIPNPQSPDQQSDITEQNLKPEAQDSPQVVYDESFNTGVVGAVNQIEEMIFNMVFNNLPFPTRVSNLEDKLLSKSETMKSRKKPLMERVQKLIQKSGLQQNYKPSPIQIHQVPQQPQEPNNYRYPRNYPNKQQSYTIDPNTGHLINEQTNEVVRDNFGNPISVKMPQVNLNQPIPQQNNFYNQQQYPQQNNFYNQQQYPQQGYPNNAPYGTQLNPGFPQTQIPYDLLYNKEEDQNGEQDY